MPQADLMVVFSWQVMRALIAGTRPLIEQGLALALESGSTEPF